MRSLLCVCLVGLMVCSVKSQDQGQQQNTNTPSSDQTPPAGNNSTGQDQNNTEAKAQQEFLEFNRELTGALLYIRDQVVASVNNIAGTCGCQDLRSAFQFQPPYPPRTPGGQPPAGGRPVNPNNPGNPGNPGNPLNTGANTRAGRLPTY
ncbi:hypothetical protein BaRGS_00033918 [Batillaria attramentaria]|uniref:Uncharacterized protein n=1 Tax=Batillaria attramentaria TaxID=370345 RepID=A0ABD0JJ12_9CAEN